MTDDLELAPVAEDQYQTYVRIMPTSPPYARGGGSQPSACIPRQSVRRPGGFVRG